MFRLTSVRVAALVILLAAAVCSAALSVALVSSAGRAKLAYTDRAEEGQPPEVALGVALGAFRGIFVNFLWIRANDMKQDGRFFELIQLSEAITRLQPRFPRVWVFHAWNLAYNVSVSTQTREERWNWVEAGINLLRQRGIPANPNDLLLHKELAWIFLHKIQGVADDANRYYKMRMSEEWQTVLGLPPPPNPLQRSREAAIDRSADFLRPVAEAPRQLAEVIRLNPSVQTLIDRLRTQVEEPAAAGVDPLATPQRLLNLLRRYETIQALRRSSTAAGAKRSMGPRMRAMYDAVEDESLQSAWASYLPFVRRYLLERYYFMDVADMIRFVRKYGPIDWRHPAAHSLYWAAQGVERALLRVQERNEKDFDFVNSDRMVIQSVQELYRSGQIYFDYLSFNLGIDSMYLAMPDPSFAQTYADLAHEIAKRSWADDFGKRAFTLYGAGYENFYIDVVLYFYRLGMTDLAEKYYRQIGTFEGMNLNDPERALRFSKPLSEFVEVELADRQKTPNVAVGEVTASLLGAFAAGLLGSDDELFRRQMDYAAKAHAFFMIQQRRATAVDAVNARMDVMEPDFRIHAGGVFAQFMSILTLDQAALVFKNAPDDLRRYAYDILQERFRDPENRDLAVNGDRFDIVFGEPQGMAQHRAMIDAYRREKAARNLPIEQK